MPAAGASISAPIGALTSMPSCGRARWRIGCTRSAMNALVSHPLVGMIDGVAARRSRCRDRVSYAWFSDRTRMLARRARASTSSRGQGLLAIPAQRLEAVPLQPRAGWPADPRLLDARVGGRESREQPHLLLALAEAVQRVAQPRHPLAHLLDLVRQDAVFVFERAAAGDVHATRDGGDAQHQERQRHHAADAEQRFQERLGHLHGAGQARAVRHHHDGPASLRLLPHQPFGPHIDTYGRRARAGPTATDRRENPDRAWARSPVGVLTYASPSESSTWPGRELYHTSPGPYA